MGTTGSYGFSKGERYKLSYNHLDSYLDGLGEDIVGFIKTTTIKEMNDIFDKIIMVGRYTFMSDEWCDKYQELGLYDGEYLWQEFLGKYQGDLNYFKKGLRHMANSMSINDYEEHEDMDDDEKEEIKEMLESYCSENWTYVINLDTNKLEICCSSMELENNEIEDIFKRIFNLEEVSYSDYLIGELDFEGIEESFKVVLDKYEEFEKERDKILDC